uniref:Neurogenic mastermind-like N-terminal domain-containing protein n=1 Tax=Strigamia maritima TaxID=126957 RepID=T1JCF4_STRMM
MGDVLPPKKQAIVERLRRRIEDYRQHHDSCLPRYEIATNGLYQQHKQGTILLQQRYLEPKSKKQNKKSNSEQQHKKEQLGSANQQKILKRPSESTSDYEEEHPSKLSRTCNNGNNPNMTQFSVEIVQQFTSTGSSQSQQIQTNVTVKALSGNVKEGANSNSGSTANSKMQDQNRNTIECKQEPELELDGCLLGSGDPLTNGNTGLPDSLSNFAFMEDSTDEIIHPDTLKDLIAELTPDIIADFNFDKFEDTTDSVKNSDDHDKDLVSSTSSGLLDVGKSLGTNQFSSASSNATSSLFDSVTSSGSMQHGRLPNYPPLGLDFNIKEPSPAAQTLKQMAEQHQNMQQKQMQIGISSPHSRSPFGNDFALPPAPQYSNGQPSGEYMGPPSNSGPYIGKSSPANMFPFSQAVGNSGMMKQEPNGNVYNTMNMDMDMCKRQQHAMHMQRLASSVDQKPNLGPPNNQAGPGRNSLSTPPGVQTSNQPLSFGSTKPLSHYTEPVTTSSVGNVQANSTPVATQSGNNNLLQNQYIQGTGMAPGQYPNPSRSQSRPSLQISQTQQIHINQANQQLQVSQGQHIQLQDMSSTQAQQQSMYGFPNQSPADQFQMSISQSQSVNFNQPLISGRGNQSGMPNMDATGRMPTPSFDKMDPNLRQKMMQQQMMRQQMIEKQKMMQQMQQQQQQQQQQQHHMAFMNRPPPEYKPQQPVVGQQQQSMGAQMAGLPNSYNQNVRAMGPNPGSVNTLRGGPTMQQMSSARMMQPGGVPRQPVANRFNGPATANRMPNKGQNGPGSGFSSALMRGQRPPNVNVGPEGLNISQRRPNSQDWRQMMMQGQKFGAAGMMQPGQNRAPDFGNGAPMMAASYASMQATSGGMQMSAMQQQQVRINMAGNNPGRTGTQMLSGPQSIPNMRRGSNAANMQMASSGALGPDQGVGNSNFLPSGGGGSVDFNLDLLDNLPDPGDATDLLSSFDSVIPGGASYMLDGGL